MNTLIVVLSVFCIVNAGKLDWRVIGGQKADDGQFPYQVSVRNFGRHYCGGSILNKNWVLTAAHCVAGGSVRVLSVYVGSNLVNAGGKSYSIKRSIFHEDLNMITMHNDIALLELIHDIEFSATVQPIPINTAPIASGSDLVLTGWGRTKYPGGSMPNIDLNFIHLKSISTKDCDAQMSDVTIDDTQVCTLTKIGEGACEGDSGGPLVYNGSVAGIVSFGRGCAKGYPDVFTNVSKYIDWIHKHMNNYLINN